MDLPLVFSKEQEIRGLEWIGNTNYWPVTKVQLVVDGKESAVFDTDGNNEPQLPPEIADRLSLAKWIAIAKAIDPDLGKRLLLQNKEAS